MLDTAYFLRNKRTGAIYTKTKRWREYHTAMPSLYRTRPLARASAPFSTGPGGNRRDDWKRTDPDIDDIEIVEVRLEIIEPHAKPTPVNAVQCLTCGMVLRSHYKHDYQSCDCINGTFVDGGLEYTRVGGMDLTQIKVLSHKEYEDLLNGREPS